MKKIYLLYCLFALAFISCQKEELLPVEPQNSYLETVSQKEALDLLNNFSDTKTFSKSFENSYAKPHLDLMAYEELLNTEEKILVIPATINNNSGYSRILMMKFEGIVEARIMTIYPTGSSVSQYFSGNMVLRSLDGEFLIGYKVQNGVFISKLLPAKNKSQNKMSDCDEAYSKESDDFCYSELDEVMLDSSNSEPTPYVSISTIYAIDSGGTEDDNYYYKAFDDGGGGGGGDTTPEEEDKIFVELDGKALCAYLKLKNLDLFKKTIGVFDNNDNFTLNIIYGDCADPADACTNGSEIGNGIVTIKIENIGYGSLDLAALFLHEGIHAEIYKYVEEYKRGIDPSKRTDLLHYYFHYKAQNGLDLGTTYAQHQYMADNFVKPIAQAIQQLDGYKYTLDHYMGFGWDGLRSYGYDGYYDNGQWISLNKSLSSDYYKKQQTVLLNTIFNKDCNQ